MKKLILTALALVMFTGCSAEEAKEQPKNTIIRENVIYEEITFENVVYETFEGSTTYWD